MSCALPLGPAVPALRHTDPEIVKRDVLDASPSSPSGGWGYLGNMYVSRRCRNRGIGRLLAGALLAEADSLGLERVVLNPTVRAVPFYERSGFCGAHELLLRTHSSSGADTEVMTSG